MVHSARSVLPFWLIFHCALVAAQEVNWYGTWNDGTNYRYSTFFGVYVEILVNQRTPVSYDTIVINAASYYGQVGAANFSATGKYAVWIGPLIPQEISPGPTSLSVKQFTSEVTSITIHVTSSLNQTGLIIYDISFRSTGSSSTTATTTSSIISGFTPSSSSGVTMSNSTYVIFHPPRTVDLQTQGPPSQDCLLNPPQYHECRQQLYPARHPTQPTIPLRHQRPSSA